MTGSAGDLTDMWRTAGWWAVTVARLRIGAQVENRPAGVMEMIAGAPAAKKLRTVGAEREVTAGEEGSEKVEEVVAEMELKEEVCEVPRETKVCFRYVRPVDVGCKPTFCI